jgi:hypothetical protein
VPGTVRGGFDKKTLTKEVLGHSHQRKSAADLSPGVQK